MDTRISLFGTCLALALVVGCTGGPGSLPDSVSGSGTGSVNPIRRTGGGTVDNDPNGSSRRETTAEELDV